MAARKKKTRKKKATSKKAPSKKKAPAKKKAAAFDMPLPTTAELAPVETAPVTTFGLVDPDGTPKVKDVLDAASLTRKGALSIYKTMLLVRALDERMMMHQRQGRIGFYGACTGQEAVPIATAEALEAYDWIFPALREGPAMLHRGYDLVKYLAQIFGNSGDTLKGRNMPSHMADRSVNQVSWSSVIGPQITQAAGAAYAARYLGDDAVAVGFMGDGATSSADFHTGLNFASVWKAPAIFICQNNHWSISVPTQKQTSAPTIAQKAVGYGIPGFRVDGNDALAVHKAVAEAAVMARKGEGPVFLECVTYRIGAHSSSDDPRVYRDEREVDVWKKRDPVDRMRALLLEIGGLTEKKDAAWRDEAKARVAAAVKEAEALPDPPRDTLFTDVYETPPWHLQEQADEFNET